MKQRCTGTRLGGFGYALALICALAQVPIAGADESDSSADAQALVRQATTRLFAAVGRDRNADPRKHYALMDEYASHFVDFEKISKRVLGKHWRSANPSQRKRFVREFKTLIIRSYTAAIVSNADADVTYLPLRESEGESRVTVCTQMTTSRAQPISIDYRLYLKAGEWKVYDLVVNGVSLVLTHRSHFTRQVTKMGLDSLIEQLALKNRETRDGDTT